MLKSKKLKAFTLVEMLIVIVIIGVLAAAILPNLIGARNRANDVARVAALNKINAGIQAYIADTGRVPAGCGGLSQISGMLATAGMIDLPMDPNLDTQFNWVWSGPTPNGEYGYCAITANGSTNGAYVLMAKVERSSNANYVVFSGTSANTIDGGTTLENLQTCSSFVAQAPGAATETDLQDWVGNEQDCEYEEGMGELRYIVIQS